MQKILVVCVASKNTRDIFSNVLVNVHLSINITESDLSDCSRIHH